MLQLVDPSKEYWLKHPSGAEFLLRHWTVAMQEQTDRECFKIVDDKAQYDQARERELKLSLALVNWKNIELDGMNVECTDSYKRLLPVGVVFWIIKDIDERAGLRMTDAEKKT